MEDKVGAAAFNFEAADWQICCRDRGIAFSPQANDELNFFPLHSNPAQTSIREGQAHPYRQPASGGACPSRK